MQKTKQILYKPKKEKIVLKEPVAKVTGDQVLEYFYDLLFEHRGFVLTTLLILSWTLFIVTA
jgi:hypothetical protein